VLRDYLTDLFPIMERARRPRCCRSFRCWRAAGCSRPGPAFAPRHVEQFQHEGYLRWDSLGEFLALGASLDIWRRQVGIRT